MMELMKWKSPDRKENKYFNYYPTARKQSDREKIIELLKKFN